MQHFTAHTHKHTFSSNVLRLHHQTLVTCQHCQQGSPTNAIIVIIIQQSYYILIPIPYLYLPSPTHLALFSHASGFYLTHSGLFIISRIAVRYLMPKITPCRQFPDRLQNSLFVYLICSLTLSFCFFYY